MNLIKLAERVEAATGPDRDLDRAIVAEAQKGMRHPWFISPPPFTASIDAAMQLVPEGWSCALLADIGKPVQAALQKAPGTGYAHAASTAATPALALTAAALRAKAGEG